MSTRPHHKHLVFAAACLGMLLFGIVFLSLGSANNLLAERFHLDDSGIGTLTFLLPFGILAGSLTFGPVVDRFGYKWLLIAAALTVGAGLEGMAFTDGIRAVQFSVFLIGLGGGVLNGATNALAADVSEGERGAKLSLLGVFFGLGALGMPGTLAALSTTFSLSQIIAGIGAFVLLPAAYFLVIAFPPPKQQVHADSSLGQMLRLLKNPVFLFAGLALAIQSGMEGLSSDWIARYFKKVVLVGDAVPEWKTLLGLMAVTGAMVVARLLLGSLLKKVPSPWVLFGSIGLSAAGSLLLSQGGYGLSLAAALLIGAGLAAAFPLVLSHIGDRYPQQSGTAFSVIFFLALVGNMTINKLFGQVAQIHGIQQYTKVMLVCLACSAVLLFLVLKQINNPQSKQIK